MTNNSDEPKGRARGGKARAASLSPERRSEIARNAARARHGVAKAAAPRRGNPLAWLEHLYEAGSPIRRQAEVSGEIAADIERLKRRIAALRGDLANLVTQTEADVRALGWSPEQVAAAKAGESLPWTTEQLAAFRAEREREREREAAAERP